jgi:hypothetical protein
MKILTRILFVCLAVVVCVGNVRDAQGQYLHPKVTENRVTIRNAVLLPAKVEITKESAKGSEMMLAESEKISVSVSDAVTESLKHKKIGVLQSPFVLTEMDDNRKQVLADIQNRYDALLPKLVDKSKDIKKARFTLGDEVMLLNVDKETDVLVFIRGQGRIFTKGKTAFSLINIFNLDFPFATITVGLVDARSGEVLAFTKPVTASSVLKDPKSLNKFIAKSLKKLPQSS